MPSRSRILLALAVAIPLTVVGLTVEQAVRNYPAEDGFLLANGEVLGGDFVAFYTGGTLFAEDRDRLYDLEHQRSVRQSVLGSAESALDGELPFVYPPLVAAMAAPLSRLPFQRAFLVWSLVGIGASLASLIYLIRHSGATELVPTPVLVVCCLGFTPYAVDAVFGGQAAWIGVTLLSLVGVAVLRNQDRAAGALMSLSYYKPPLFLLLLIALSVGRGRRFLAGFGVGAAVFVGLTVVAVGPDGLLAYGGTVSRYTYGQSVMEGIRLPPEQGMGLVAFGVSLLPSTTLVLSILAVPFVALTVVACRLLGHERRDMRRLGLIVGATASVAFSLQVLDYDLALLLVPILLAVGWYAGRRRPRRLAGLLALLAFYLEFALREVHVVGVVMNASWFLFPIALGLLGWVGWRLPVGVQEAGRLAGATTSDG